MINYDNNAIDNCYMRRFGMCVGLVFNNLSYLTFINLIHLSTANFL